MHLRFFFLFLFFFFFFFFFFAFSKMASRKSEMDQMYPTQGALDSQVFKAILR